MRYLRSVEEHEPFCCADRPLQTSTGIRAADFEHRQLVAAGHLDARLGKVSRSRSVDEVAEDRFSHRPRMTDERHRLFGRLVGNPFDRSATDAASSNFGRVGATTQSRRTAA